MTMSGDGLYQLTHADLQVAGLLVDALDPRTWRLFYQGAEIPIRAEGDVDGRFAPGDVVLYYGRSQDALYADRLIPTNRYTGTNFTDSRMAGPMACASPSAPRSRAARTHPHFPTRCGQRSIAGISRPTPFARAQTTGIGR